VEVTLLLLQSGHLRKRPFASSFKLTSFFLSLFVLTVFLILLSFFFIYPNTSSISKTETLNIFSLEPKIIAFFTTIIEKDIFKRLIISTNLKFNTIIKEVLLRIWTLFYFLRNLLCFSFFFRSHFI